MFTLCYLSNLTGDTSYYMNVLFWQNPRLQLGRSEGNGELYHTNAVLKT